MSSNNNFIVLSNELAECKISLFGGNILSYRPKNQKYDVFWVGDLNSFDNVQAIRGGVPVCWPRFAEEALNSDLPRHGFARLSNWSLQSVFVDENKIEATLFLQPDAKFALNVNATLNIKITDKLECCLETYNYGEEVFKFSEALHAYFYVGNRDNVIIKGLGGHKYRDALDGKIYHLEKDLSIDSEFDAAFINHKDNVQIVDNDLNRIITLEKSKSNSTIVWNPNKDLKEMSQGQYKNFICVEPANQGDLFVSLEPKETHKISMLVKVNNLK